MSAVARFWRSTIGKKIVMAVTGLIGVGFVIGHMAGNLQVFLGPEKFNAYAAFLKSLGGLLWLVRAVLVAAVVLHVVAAVQLTRMRGQARPVGYRSGGQKEVSTFASRTIRWGGALLLFFIVFHILHFTTLDIFPDYSHTDAYGNVVKGFGKWWVVLLYVLAMAALGLHLFHGAWSSFRTLGASPASDQPLKRRVALLVAAIVWLGFTVIPLGVFFGFAPAPAATAPIIPADTAAAAPAGE
jgi:succinate dehydrogenase / fumarate reductase cytochrome b subunit